MSQDDLAVPDTGAIDRYIDRADYILMTHAHYVHMLDVPYIASTRKAVVIGNESVANIARDYGVPDEQIVTIRGGEDFDFGTFSVRVLPSLHTQPPGKHYFNSGNAPAGAKWPLRFKDFIEGGVVGFLIRLNGVQMLAFGDMNYIEREVTGLHPDVVLMGADPMRKEIFDYTGRLVRALDFPRLVVATHWDFSQLPFDASFDKQLKDADEFAAEVHTVSPQSRVIVPRHFEWIEFSPIDDRRYRQERDLSMDERTLNGNKALIRKLFESEVNQKNLNMLESMAADDYVSHNDSVVPASDVRQSSTFLAAVFEAFPDTHVTIEDMIAEGDKVVVRNTWRGTFRGAWMGIQPTGKELTWTGIVIWRIKDGKIAERWANVNFNEVVRKAADMARPGKE